MHLSGMIISSWLQCSSTHLLDLSMHLAARSMHDGHADKEFQVREPSHRALIQDRGLSHRTEAHVKVYTYRGGPVVGH